MSIHRGRSLDFQADFEPTARRIRSRARRLLAELPVEDPNVVWARRQALLVEINGCEPVGPPPPETLKSGVFRPYWLRRARRAEAS